MDQMFGAAIGLTIGLVLVSLIGLAIGALARFLLPGKDPLGWFSTILLGIAGSWVGTFLTKMLGLHGQVTSFIGAVLGAMLLLVLVRAVRKPG